MFIAQLLNLFVFDPNLDSNPDSGQRQCVASSLKWWKHWNWRTQQDMWKREKEREITWILAVEYRFFTYVCLHTPRAYALGDFYTQHLMKSLYATISHHVVHLIKQLKSKLYSTIYCIWSKQCSKLLAKILAWTEKHWQQNY